jgi:hypothetical protein
VHIQIGSSASFLVCVGSLLAGFVWATFFPESPFGVFAPAVVALAGAYFTNRVVQNSKHFGGGGEHSEPSEE